MEEITECKEDTDIVSSFRQYSEICGTQQCGLGCQAEAARWRQSGELEVNNNLTKQEAIEYLYKLFLLMKESEEKYD